MRPRSCLLFALPSCPRTKSGRGEQRKESSLVGRAPLELARTPNPSLRIFRAAVYVFRLQQSLFVGQSTTPNYPPLPSHDTYAVAPTCSAHPFQDTILSTVAFIPRQIDMRCMVLLSKFLLLSNTACHPICLFLNG